MYWWLSVAHRKMAMSLFKNSEVVLTLMIQAKSVQSIISFENDFSQTNHVAFREPVTYDLRLIEVIWSSE